MALAAWAALIGCSETFRFDEHSIVPTPREDADAPTKDADDAQPADCASGACPFTGAPCSGEGCQLECPYFKTCTGACGPLCTADCEEDSICQLTASERGDLKCEERARCAFTAGAGSRLECERGSDCGVRCLGSCTLRCEAGAVCSLACGPTAPLLPLAGTASCP